ncbi:MAG: TIGR00730 family Rossman fold protein [Elusimicrobiota bacterium]|jgi:uncharacterized protein (TIGR00730 family)|nr:TIGR00730 family Rossman fold protein [Elusimicrobiota bacterium]
MKNTIEETLIKKVGVFCGSSEGNNKIHIAQAKELGSLLAKENLELVYGGGNIGIMGAISNAVLDNGGRATGILIEELEPFSNKRNTQIIISPSLYERKKKLIGNSDCFFVLSGGIGTLDEFAQIFALCQLHLEHKPIVLLNTAGFFDKLIDFIKYIVDEGFLQKEYLDFLIIEDNPKTALEKCRNFKLPRIPKLKG